MKTKLIYEIAQRQIKIFLETHYTEMFLKCLLHMYLLLFIYFKLFSNLQKMKNMRSIHQEQKPYLLSLPESP